MSLSWLKILHLGGGSAVRNTVDVANVAKKTGTPIQQVKAEIATAKKTGRSKVFAGMSGRTGADTTGTPGANLKAALLAAYGPGPKGGQINVVAAANDLGVSTSTIKRWMNNQATPKPENHKALLAAARKAATTKKGRSSAAADLKASASGSKITKYGARLTVSGIQGREGYERERVVVWDLPPELAENALQAWQDGGDVGLADFMADYANSDAYGNLDDWNVWNFDDVSLDPKSR